VVLFFHFVVVGDVYISKLKMEAKITVEAIAVLQQYGHNPISEFTSIIKNSENLKKRLIIRFVKLHNNLITRFQNSRTFLRNRWKNKTV
jgi:hypothetical protein